MSLNTIGEDKTAVITAVFLFAEPPCGALAAALDRIRSAANWELQCYEITPARAEAFQCIKVPALIGYAASGDEAVRVIGDRYIEKFIDCVKDDLL